MAALSADDFDAVTAEAYGMINRAINDAELDAFVEAFALRIASFDKPTLRAAKGLPQSNRNSGRKRIRGQQS
jgi:enoyl-CoA hydratase/carnithine racemase